MTLSTHFKVEDEILDLLSVCLNAWSGTKDSSTPGVGIPQGPQPSYLLANLILHPLDKQLISEAFKYYRYMDDIKIYGYSEEELQDVLVLIDNYLKGHGLSINAKKTGINEIKESNQDSTIKELKRFDIIGEISEVSSNELFDDLSKESLNENILKNLESFSEQFPEDHNGIETDLQALKKIENIEEIKAFWEDELISVEEELPKLFKSGTTELLDPENTDDIEFIKYSAKYGSALAAMKDWDHRPADISLLKYWLFALKRYYWRANNYIITLQYYKDNAELKTILFQYYSWGKNYEWYRYHIVTCLSYNFTYSDKELRQIFRLLKSEKSDLVKYAWYCLIVRHTKDPQFLSTIKVQLSKENSNYLKMIALDYWKRDKNRENTMSELVKSIGL